VVAALGHANNFPASAGRGGPLNSFMDAAADLQNTTLAIRNIYNKSYCAYDHEAKRLRMLQAPCLAIDPTMQRAAPIPKDPAEGPGPTPSNDASEPTAISVTAKFALRIGFAFWGALSVIQACQFQWGIWGPHNFSGLAITLFFSLLHAHCIIIEDSRCAKRFVKPSLAFDLLVALALALGGLVRFMTGLGKPTALNALTIFMIALGACVKLASVLGRLSEPS
jgi:hypothetical protein